jgi:phage/plasmid-associated DNA primase
LGGGANGKGILFEIFQMFFAKKNISYMTLETMCKASFERQSIIGSRLNITTEAKGNQLDVEELKKIISSEEIEIMRKFQDPTSYKPKLKIIISSNTLPYFNDTSFGTDRRLVVFNFLNKFVTKAEYDKQPHPELKRIFLRGDKKKILAEIKKEKSSILNLFLKGLVMLEQNKWEMELSQNNKDAMMDYKIATDTFGTFIMEFYKLDESNGYDGISSIDILDHYRRWYIQNVKDKVPNYSVNLVGRRIKEIFRIEPTRHYSEDGRLSFYKIRKRNNDDNLQEIITSGAIKDIQFDGNGSKNNEDELSGAKDTEELFPNKRIS